MRRTRDPLSFAVLGFAVLMSGTLAGPVQAASARVGRLRVPPPIHAKANAKITSYSKLAPVTIRNINSREVASVRLYTAEGQVDEAVVKQLDRLLGDARDPDNVLSRTMDRRLMQLVFRAAYHFASSHVDVVSAYRRPVSTHEGVHAQGRAIDFRLQGVIPNELAAYLRAQPRVGVGIYTHPKTQFVHLDVRDQSFHWLDGSPPGRHWRERNISVKGLNLLDAKYTRNDDWPEGLTAPVVAQ
jgi:uncharacterized protein YcbK (DUF882 family)